MDMNSVPRPNRQAKLRENRKAKGLVANEVWVPRELVADLKAEFPAARGGVDWAAVARMALDRNRTKEGSP